MTGTALQPPRPVRVAPALTPGVIDFRRFMLVAAVGGLCGLVIPSLGGLRQPILILVMAALSAKLFATVVQRRFTAAWSQTAFLCAIEPTFREHARILPYLTLDYVLLGCGALTFALSRPRRGAPLGPVIAYGVYIALELAGSVFADDLAAVRGIVLPSLLMLMFIMNAGRTRLTASATTEILASYVIGAVTLMGFALRAYLSGRITWGTQSNFDASGGMPPNHVSVLLSVGAFACVVLAEDAKRLQRIVLLGIATAFGVLMVLTFSRGGTVVLAGTLVLYYVLLRKKTRRTIVALFAIIVMGAIIAYGTYSITGGRVAERYGRSDTSNRYTIAVDGMGIYAEHPVIGVGTSNFRDAITETEFARETGAHNELVRAAAEHGTLGLLTWIVFILSAFVVAFRNGEAHRSRRALRGVVLIFATTSMFYNGLKLAVQPMLVLLALSAFTALDAAPKPSPPKKRG